LIIKADKLLNLYVGLSSSEILKIQQLKLRALCSLFVSNQNQNESIKPAHIQELISKIESNAKLYNLSTDKFTTTIIRECKNVTRHSLLLAFLEKLINEKFELSVIQSRSTQGISGKIVSPASTSTFKWVVSIGQMVKISGQVKSPVNPINKLCIRVAYGIEKTGLFFIQFKNLTKLRENEYEFQIQVPFSSNQVWPTAVKIDVELCWVYGQSIFLGEMDQNPDKGLLTLHRTKFECSSRLPNTTVRIC